MGNLLSMSVKQSICVSAFYTSTLRSIFMGSFSENYSCFLNFTKDFSSFYLSASENINICYLFFILRNNFKLVTYPLFI